MRRSVVSMLQRGVHTPHGTQYFGAKMKNWPEQKIPKNFSFTAEQRFKVKPMPRDSGKIPRDFVLSVLYRNQPCEVAQLWEHCTADPGVVLDSKRHLREVLKQAREEGFIQFERDPITHAWMCNLTRERFEDVRGIAARRVDEAPVSETLRGGSVTETSEFAAAFHEMNEESKQAHLERLQAEVKATTTHLKKFQRTEIDYLPYTDLNGKVNFMWWYETRDAPRETMSLENGDAAAQNLVDSDREGGSDRSLPASAQ